MRPSTSKKLSFILGLLVFATGAMVLAGWLFHIPILTTWGDGLVTMKVNTAITFMFAAISLALLQREQVGVPYIIGKICAGIVTTIGLVTLSQFVFGTNWGIDNWLTGSMPVENN